jgi:uncharacterized membrane protein YbhN (UPF0104 family)
MMMSPEDAMADDLEDLEDLEGLEVTLKRQAVGPTAGAPARAASLVSRVMGLVKRHKSVTQALVMVVIVAFVAIAVWKSWSNLQGYQWNIQWGLLLAGFALLISQELSFALIWRSILSRMGSHLNVVAAERIYLGAEFVRYIPGNVWHVITRVLWAEQRGVPKARGISSMVIELATKIFSAALVFAVSLLFWPDLTLLAAQTHIPAQAAIIGGAVAIPLLLLGLYPPLLERALNLGLRLLKRKPTRLNMSYIDLLVITSLWALSWVVAGVGFYLITRAIVTTPLPANAIALCIGIYALGWDIGFLSFITPSGIGFREAAIAALLAWSAVTIGPSAFTIGLVVAFISRMLATGSELISIGLAYLIGGRMPLPTPEPAGDGGS